MFLSLTKLEHLRALSRTGSFARAAFDLGITQPALSRSIASLETDCATRLVDRRRGNPTVSLTDAGVAVLLEAEQLLQLAHRVTETVTGAGMDERVHVRLGIGPLLMRLIVPGAVLRVMEQYPLASFETVSEQPMLMRERLLRGDLDLVVAPNQVQPPDARIRALRLGRQTPDFQVRPGHPLLAHSRVTAQMLARFPLVSGTTWNEILPTLDPQMARLLRARVEIDNLDVLVSIVNGSDAVLMFSVPQPGWGLESLDVEAFRGLDELGDRSVDVLLRAGIELSEPAAALVEAMQETFVEVFRRR